MTTTRKKKKKKIETLEDMIAANVKLSYETYTYEREIVSNDTDRAARLFARKMLTRAISLVLIVIPLLIYLPQYLIYWLNTITGGDKIINWGFKPMDLPNTYAILAYFLAIVLLNVYGMLPLLKPSKSSSEPVTKSDVSQLSSSLSSENNAT
mgnify:CR=1 FL=1